MKEEIEFLGNCLKRITILVLGCLMAYTLGKFDGHYEDTIIEPIPEPTFKEQIQADIDAKFKVWAASVNYSPDYVPSDIETPVAEEPVPYLIDVTDSDIDLMARVVMSEASVLGLECKQAIAQTIVNRVRSSKFPNTVEQVVYQKNQYSTQDNGKPNADCYAAVQQALRYEEHPLDMYYFRMWHYHKFGTPYMEIQNCYFSTK